MTNSDKKYPIAEVFTSPQGEGVWTGTLMTFIRLAGCSVGKVMTEEKKEQLVQKIMPMQWDDDLGHCRRIPDNASTALVTLSSVPPVPEYTRMCTTYDGREFLCDTDYQTKSLMTCDELVAQIPDKVEYVCLTGGEPLMYNLCPLLHAIAKKGCKIHIETSGTRRPVIDPGYETWFIPRLQSNRYNPLVWLTVSPKLGVLREMLERAHEIKLLVDDQFTVEALPFYNEFRWDSKDNIFIQPINYENAIYQPNMTKVKALQLQYPHWKISTQMHKIWGVR
jgi:7-carboxy-7-deazaguanine synthase